MHCFLYADTFDRDSQICMMKNSNVGVERVHTHEFVEIVYIRSGSGRHYIDGKCYKVGKGCLLFINYGQTHSFQSEEELFYDNVLIKPEFLAERLINGENAFELLTLTAFADFQTLVCVDKPLVGFAGEELLQVEAVIGALHTEYARSRLGRGTVMKSYITILLSYIFRRMSQGMQKDEAAIGRIPGEILEYIENHCSEKISLGLLAEKCFYNPKYFGNIFKECYGMTVTDYIQRKRVERGCGLLLETSLSVEEIGRRVGYDDSVRFYRYFKKICGVTPHVYRKTKTRNI